MATKKRKAYKVFQDASGRWRWHLRAENGRIVADGGQGYSSERKAIDALARKLDSIIDKSLQSALIEFLRAAGRIE